VDDPSDEAEVEQIILKFVFHLDKEIILRLKMKSYFFKEYDQKFLLKAFSVCLIKIKGSLFSLSSKEN